MSDGSDFLRRLVAMLDRALIPHMVAGSFASTLHGTPRATQDIDLVIDPSGEALLAFIAGLAPDDYYASDAAARDALRRRSQFNVIDMATGWKADLIVRKARPYSVEEFRRRMPERILGVDVFVATPEDTILTKLEWAAMSGSERQLRDVAGILAVKQEELDREYIERWAQELGVLEAWRRLNRPAGGSDPAPA
jgi:hypothetical protein